MGKIVLLMGKSGSGKDTVYKELVQLCPRLKKITGYTTRPKREWEEEGKEYYFRNEAFFKSCLDEGKVIEYRIYHTVCGDWTYFTLCDGQIRLDRFNYLMIGTLESYEMLKKYYGCGNLLPVYLYVEDGQRLRRLIEREEKQKYPVYKEICRRFLADEEDFSPARLKKSGITRQYRNYVLKDCLSEIKMMLEMELMESF